LTYKKDNNEFLLFLLKQLFQEHLAFQRNRYGADRVATAGAAIKVSEEDLKSRVCFDFTFFFQFILLVIIGSSIQRIGFETIL
jgi:hypothetical protein